jgi:sRNA-binding carbon storage regulator CsrA
MLVLTRRSGERIDIFVPTDPEVLKEIAQNGRVHIEIVCYGLNNWNQCKLAFSAPRQVVIDRREIAVQKDPSLAESEVDAEAA